MLYFMTNIHINLYK